MPGSDEAQSKVCPFCAETIKAAAIKCRFCGSDLSVFVASDAFLPLEPHLTAAMSLAPMEEGLFRLVPISNERHSVDGPLDVWEVTGRLTNIDSAPSSYVVNLFGFLDGVQDIRVGIGDTETEIVHPGKSCTWLVRILARDMSPPVRFEYHVQRQGHPGDIGAKRLADTVLENMAAAGPMGVTVMNAFAAQFEALEREQYVASRPPPFEAERPSRPASSPAEQSWRLPAEESARGVCPTCLKEKRLTAHRQLIASHVFNGEKCPGSGLEPTRVTKTAAVPATPVRPKKPAAPADRPVKKLAPPTSSAPNTSASIPEPPFEIPRDTAPLIATPPAAPAMSTTAAGAGWTPVARVKSAALGRRGDVGCRCSRCNHQWFVPCEIVNALADLQSVSGRLVRWGRKTQHVGNVLTPGLGTLLSGRSGRKVESQRDFDAAIRGEFRCSACGSAEVFLAL